MFFSTQVQNDELSTKIFESVPQQKHSQTYLAKTATVNIRALIIIEDRTRPWWIYPRT